MKQRLSLGNSSQAIVVTNMEFSDKGFAIGQKTALIPIDPDMNGEEILAEAAKFEWEIFGEPNIQGFASAKVKREYSEEELASQTQHRRSILTTLAEVSEVQKKQVAEAGVNATPSRVGSALNKDLVHEG